MKLGGENAIKTVYNLHRFWMSMSAIFGFTAFHIGRMTEVLTPDITITSAKNETPELKTTNKIVWSFQPGYPAY